MLCVSDREVAERVTLADACATLERALGAPPMPAGQLTRRRAHVGHTRLNVLVGAAGDPPRLAVKAYTTRRSNALLLFDTDGALLATIEATALSRLRTAAATAVAVRHLSRPASTRALLIGTGFQALAQAEALLQVRPVESLRVWSPTAAHRRDVAGDLRHRLAIDARPVEDPATVAADADLVVTATTAIEPVLRGAWLAPGAHVCLVGANQAHRREADVELFTRSALVVVDDRAQARAESGELAAAVDGGATTWGEVVELADVVRGNAAGRRHDDDITTFVSLGTGLQDAALASLVYDRVTGATTARGQGLPTRQEES